ncbi:GGDEF domain-containing protein [Pseudorhizobium pelagicum]|uniref:diguanylate cyclase n=1 Tax=Pseudorhizobium pelagicum TaxID=1509405 RepID=A0A922T9K7_9HYPH|nr:GGDEF domain-containing protein [Pseudorhizobium pelagicum]KEQ02927.1 diguanylate cyclase [Pseudorhizobium pelagicum]KEQ03056.1 diguanylate cyclase [Pseudorhizobium pelagicum]
MSPAANKEVEHLLAGRTRDIQLSPELTRRFRDRSWPQMSKIVRAWMIWVVVLDLSTLAVNAVLLPTETVRLMFAPASILIPAALGSQFAFRKPRPLWVQGAAILLGLFLILMSVALVGVSAGGEFYERHLTIMLFVAVTAIIIFPVPFSWTMSIAAYALVIYLAFQMSNPMIGRGSALAGALFFATGVIATVAARHTANILAYKTFLLVLRDRMRLDELTDTNARLELLARTDPLTGIANRRWMIETLDQVWGGDGEQTQGNAILMCDVDHFKQLNDRLGHAEGDRCLVKIAGIIQSSLRDERDQVARYGGEEFLVLLRNADEKVAAVVAEQIRSRVEAASLPNPLSTTCPYVTVSIGVSVTEEGEHKVSADALQRQADEALYRAKQGGRNRVAIFPTVLAKARCGEGG